MRVGLGPESLEEFTPLERLRKHRRGTKRGGLLTDVFGIRGHNDHLEPRVEDADSSQRLQAAQSRHSEIEHHDVWPFTLDPQQCREAVDRFENLDPLRKSATIWRTAGLSSTTRTLCRVGRIRLDSPHTLCQRRHHAGPLRNYRLSRASGRTTG